MSLSDLGKMAVECFSNLCLNKGALPSITYLTGVVSTYGSVPSSWQINQEALQKFNHLKLVQLHL